MQERNLTMFTKGFGPNAATGDTIECDLGEGWTVTAQLYEDDCRDRPDECDEGFWPSRNPEAAGYVHPSCFGAEQVKAVAAMAAWEAGDWFFCGVVVRVKFMGHLFSTEYGNALWGVECNHPSAPDNAYLLTVANDLLPEALDDAKRELAGIIEAHRVNHVAQTIAALKG